MGIISITCMKYTNIITLTIGNILTLAAIFSDRWLVKSIKTIQETEVNIGLLRNCSNGSCLGREGILEFSAARVVADDRANEITHRYVDGILICLIVSQILHILALFISVIVIFVKQCKRCVFIVQLVLLYATSGLLIGAVINAVVDFDMPGYEKGPAFLLLYCAIGLMLVSCALAGVTIRVGPKSDSSYNVLMDNYEKKHLVEHL